MRTAMSVGAKSTYRMRMQSIHILKAVFGGTFRTNTLNLKTGIKKAGTVFAVIIRSVLCFLEFSCRSDYSAESFVRQIRFRFIRKCGIFF